MTNFKVEKPPVKIGGSDLVPPLTTVTLLEDEKFTLENDSPSHPRSDMLIFLGEINTLAAPSHAPTSKLAVTEDIKLSSSEVPLKNVSSI